jgi:hypothetical protein
MRLSWNEIRVRAAAFAKDWAGEGYEKGQTQLFYRDFFEVFGVPVRRVAAFEEPVKNLGDSRGFIDLFWKGVVLVEQKSIGRDLKKAKKQALDYFPGLKDADLPRYILLSDFQTFELYDLEEDDEIAFDLADLPKHVEKFGFVIGVQKRSFKDQDPVNIKASELVGKLHDALEEAGYTGHDLEQFLVRIVFCLFADDTGIFEPRDIFLELLESRTREDGSDLGGWITNLFQVLNTPEGKRHKNIDEDLARFPYVNGDLFRDTLLIPSFDAKMRKRLIEACQFDWSGISPAIFGSLFQSVMEKAERRAKGAHYTTEKNILKVIEPLFLDDLRAEFKRLKSRKDSRRRPELLKFQEKLGKLRFFDPACGCGNFLVITYRELRQLEIEVLKEIFTSGQLDALAETLSVIDVDQFYGIEIGEFPARIAETALWMMDHIMNNRLSLEFGLTYVRIPLTKSPHIIHGDALETDWTKLLAPQKCSYVFGNPPFIGAKYQTEEQRAQVRRIADLGKSGGTLDFVTAWFITAGKYVEKGQARIGFVATNSITQGEQVAQLWPVLFNRCKLEIAFAHRTFAWGSDAKGKAHVHVVIIGLTRRDQAPKKKRLFTYDDIKGEPHESGHAALSPYLFDASGLADPHIVVRETSKPINGLQKLITGTQPLEGGNLLFNDREKDEFLAVEPAASKVFRPYPGAHEFINGVNRWILHTAGLSPTEIKSMPQVRERLRRVKAFRANSKRKTTLAIADMPSRYGVTVVPDRPFLVIPQVSSERREYVPIGWAEPPVIPSEKLRLLYDAEVWQFAILTSRMHMAWMRAVTGRMKSDYMYSVGVVFNTFPFPDVSQERLNKLVPLAQAVLSARNVDSDATLADLYASDLMPIVLRKAHQSLDRAVDKLYRRSGFASDSERVEHLLGLYEKMAAPMIAAAKPKRTRRKARTAKPKSYGVKKK